MCVIAAKPAGVKMPSDNLIQDMWDANSHGAGIMILREGADHIILKKGYMKLKSFMRAIKNLNIQDSDIVVMHFRITTSGGTNKHNTHPFVISPKPAGTERLDVKTKRVCLAHNGIITPLNGIDKRYSDTALFVRDYLSVDGVYQNIYASKSMQDMIESYIGSSKLSFLCPNQGLLLIGDWKESEGIHYSNLNHEDTYNYYRRFNSRNYSGSLQQKEDSKIVNLYQQRYGSDDIASGKKQWYDDKQNLLEATSKGAIRHVYLHKDKTDKDPTIFVQGYNELYTAFMRRIADETGLGFNDVPEGKFIYLKSADLMKYSSYAPKGGGREYMTCDYCNIMTTDTRWLENYMSHICGMCIDTYNVNV